MARGPQKNLSDNAVASAAAGVSRSHATTLMEQFPEPQRVIVVFSNTVNGQATDSAAQIEHVHTIVHTPVGLQLQKQDGTCGFFAAGKYRSYNTEKYTGRN